jgi:hypothetical protein
MRLERLASRAGGFNNHDPKLSMIRFACPACDAVMTAPPQKAGHKFNCLKCGQRIQIPSPPRGTMLAKPLPPKGQPAAHPLPAPVLSPAPSSRPRDDKVDEPHRAPDSTELPQRRNSATPWIVAGVVALAFVGLLGLSMAVVLLVGVKTATVRPVAQGDDKEPVRRGEGVDTPPIKKANTSADKDKAGNEPEPVKEPKPVDWGGVTATGRVGDVEVELVRCGNDPSPYSEMVRGELRRLDSMSRARVRITNKAQTKNVTIARWAGLTMQDEHGNSYRYKAFEHGFKLYSGFTVSGPTWRNVVVPSDLPLHAGKQLTCELWFEVMSDKSSEARIIIPGNVFGASDSVRLRIATISWASTPKDGAKKPKR